MKEPTKNPRDAALRALSDRDGNFAAHLEHELADGISPEDRALARELTMGIVRRHATLDPIIEAYLKLPGKKLSGLVRDILRMGAYQMIFLSKIPHFAAVSQAVDQARRSKHSHQGGMVNAILRSISRELTDLMPGDGKLDAEAIPVECGQIRRINRVVFPDPASEPVAHFAAAYSLPEELAARWIDRFGSVQEAAKVADACNSRAPLILRVNKSRASCQEIADRLNAGVFASRTQKARVHENGMSVALPSFVNIPTLDLFNAGLVQPQDPTASAVTAASGVAPGMRVLDLCAAPGTKTTHLAELMENSGEIVAVDVAPEKLAMISDNTRRMGVKIVRTMLSPKLTDLTLASFDLVLADVPCSNTGVLARRAEARWRFSADELSRIVGDQQFLANAAANFVKPGGRVIYSTCSIEPEENQQMAAWLMRRSGRLKLVEEKLTLPSGGDDIARWCDGGYYAIFNAR